MAGRPQKGLYDVAIHPPRPHVGAQLLRCGLWQ